MFQMKDTSMHVYYFVVVALNKSDDDDDDDDSQLDQYDVDYESIVKAMFVNFPDYLSYRQQLLLMLKIEHVQCDLSISLQG